MATRKASSRHLLPILGGFVLLIIATLAICYFALWRPTDSDYVNAIRNVTSLQTDIQDAGDLLASITKPANVTTTTVSGLSEATDSIQKTLDAMSADKLATKNADLYAKLRDAAAKYQSSLQDTVTSLQQYLAILNNCSALVEKLNMLSTTAAFTTASADCTRAIDTAKQAPGTAFTDQYLSGYTTNAELLLARYKNVVTTHSSTAAKNAVTQIQQRIVLDGDTVLNLTISSDAGAKAGQLTAALTQQKASFFR